jgi:glycosyltransferase involved in cell wall biosynthesis
MIKILFLIHDLGPGGAEKVLVNLVNNMDKNVFDITVMSLFGGGVNERFLDPDVRYQVVYKKTFPMNSHVMKLFSTKMLHKAYIREKYDIEVSCLEGPSARIISGCGDSHTKLVSWIHVEQHSRKVASQAFRTYRESEKVYGRFDAVAAVSQYVRRDFMALYPHIRNIHVLYNTIETEKILSLKDEEVPEGLFSDKEFKICGVGKIVPVKGFMKLAKVHKKLRDHNYPVHTYILGEGPEKEKIEDYIRVNGMEDTFTFLGYQINPYKYVARCDAFVCASSAEGFSTAATEAVLVNTPVITTPVSGMEELLGEDPCGVICGTSEEDIYRELRRWVRDPEIVALYKNKTKVRGREFQQRKTIQRTEDFLKALLEYKI